MKLFPLSAQSLTALLIVLSCCIGILCKGYHVAIITSLIIIIFYHALTTQNSGLANADIEEESSQL